MLDQEQMLFLKSLENRTTKQILQFLNENNQPQTFDSSMTLFKAEFREALTQINQYVAEYLFQDAVLIPELVRIPCSGSYKGKYATIILFRHIIPIHVHLQPNNNVKFMPLSLFKAHQWSIMGQGETLFTEDIRRDFLPILNDLERIRPSHSSYPVITTIQKSKENFDPVLSGINSDAIAVNQTAVEAKDCETLWVDEILAGIVWNY